MPIGAAKGFVELAPEASAITDRTADDPEVRFVDGVDVAGDRLTCFWDLDRGFEAAAAAAAGLDANTATADDVLAALADSGAGDLFPQFSAEEAAKVRDEGKIPNYASWVERVRAGTCSWDGALTAAALASFTKDQDALDERIRGLI
jgi:transaldolase